MANFNSTNRKRMIITFTSYFIVITAGIIAGLFIASKLGIISAFWHKRYDPQALRNTSNLKIGQLLPDIQVTDGQDNLIALPSILPDGNVIIGFVSEGCGACDQFLTAFFHEQAITSDYVSVILLTDNPHYFQNNYPFPAYKIITDFQTEFSISEMPTILGINKNKKIIFISSGFSPQVNSDLIYGVY